MIKFVTTNSGEWGGSELLWQQTAKSLGDRGIPVRVEVPLNKLQYCAKLNTLAGVTLDKSPEILTSSHWARQAYWALRSLNRRLVLHHARHPNLYVISQGSLGERLPALSKIQRTRIPYVIIIQLVTEFQHVDDNTAETLRQVLLGASQIFFVSERNRALTERQVGSLPNSRIVRNPFLTAYEPRLTYPPDASFHIAMTARLHTYHKGQDILLEVLAQNKWRSRNLTVSLYGKGPHEQSLRREVIKLGLASKVLFKGHCSSIEEIWQHSHAAILCSRIEGLPIALVEAMLCARCPIVTDVGGATELVEDNVNGFVARYPTPRDVDEALERAWQRRHEWEKIGTLAANSVRSKIPRSPADTFADTLTTLTETRMRKK